MSIAYKPYQRATDLGTPGPSCQHQAHHPDDRRRRSHRPRGHDGHAGSRLDRHEHSEALRYGQPRAVRLVPPVSRRDRRHEGPSSVVHDRSRAGDEGRDAERQGREDPRATSWSSTSPTTRSIASPARPTATASSRTWRAPSACARCATAMPARTTSTRRKTRATRISRSTRASASSARAACVLARKCRARSR